MKEMIVKYTRFGLRRTLKKQIPDNYAEMSPIQFLSAIRLAKGWINEERFYADFFGLTPYLLKKMDLYSLYKLAEIAAFIRDARTPHNAFYLETLRGGLHAPLPKLYGMSFQQFMTADTFYTWYVSKEQTKYLDTFVASLYLKKNESLPSSGSKKGVDLETRACEISRIPLDLKYAILINWMLLKSWLGKTYPYLFQGSDTDTGNRDGHSPTHQRADWLALFDHFVGDNIADINAYKELPCMDAFRLINRRIKEAKNKR